MASISSVPQAAAPINRLLRRKEVERIVGLGRAHLYALIKKNQFPAPIKLTERTVAWPEAEITAWVSERIASSRGSSDQGGGR